MRVLVTVIVIRGSCFPTGRRIMKGTLSAERNNDAAYSFTFNEQTEKSEFEI